MLNPLLISLEKGKQFIAHANNAYEGGETGVSFDVGEIALPRYRGIYLQSCRRIDDLGSLRRTSSRTLYQQTSC
ncbi:hypothetical protein I314_01673 [Cryptococcus bacillisporus CA1873]|uniref:Uncharacterized protein n=1 Tax=Cryptococcus bacillisporus CA1873 TaxID=1296111 RepID=A0ABR5BG79_CRYGA|nr:hypothetical protein I314_01673 [Cryptococcus bacillisporus CA1873]|eukprot:KIR68179.1 hypothetical protein I314_01673 [Cryptococcus gattii CA1873]